MIGREPGPRFSSSDKIGGTTSRLGLTKHPCPLLSSLWIEPEVVFVFHVQLIAVAEIVTYCDWIRV